MRKWDESSIEESCMIWIEKNIYFNPYIEIPLLFLFKGKNSLLMSNKYIYDSQLKWMVSLEAASSIQLKKPFLGDSHALLVDGKEVAKTNIHKVAAKKINEFFSEIYSNKDHYFDQNEEGRPIIKTKDIDLKKVETEKEESRVEFNRVKAAEKKDKENEGRRKQDVINQAAKAFEEKYGKANLTEYRGERIVQGMSKGELLSAIGLPSKTKKEVLKTKTKELLSYERIDSEDIFEHPEFRLLSSHQKNARIKIKIENGIVVGWDE